MVQALLHPLDLCPGAGVIVPTSPQQWCKRYCTHLTRALVQALLQALWQAQEAQEPAMFRLSSDRSTTELTWHTDRVVWPQQKGGWGWQMPTKKRD
jgi:hypothetical protein